MEQTFIEIKYDDHGNLIYTKDSDGLEEFFERTYERDFSSVYYKNSEGYEFWKERYLGGYIIKLFCPNGYKEYKIFNSDKVQIGYFNSLGEIDENII